MTDNTEALPPLLPCPFCGKDAAEVRQAGSPLQFCLVVCGWCGLRHESSDIGNASGTSWNTRAALAQRQQVPEAPFLFVAMDDDKRAHLTWCADEAAVREAVKSAMFWLPDGEELDADHAEQLAGSVEELLDSGALIFEGDAPLYLFRVGSAAQAEPQSVGEQALAIANESARLAAKLAAQAEPQAPPLSRASEPSSLRAMM